MEETDVNRFIRLAQKIKLSKGNKCWEWVGTVFSLTHKDLPYGQFWWGEINGKDKTISSHRAIWTLTKGAIPDGLQVLHKCNNSICCRPDHLYLGTHENNMADRDACGHTSKGEHRYNFLRTKKLTDRVIKMRSQKVKIKDIMNELNVSRNTVYRCLGVIK